MGDNNDDGLLANATKALPIAGAIFNPIMQGVQNRKQRKWEEKMAQRQRDWAIEDWNRSNQYNSPSSQMQRLKDAGLNPNLVYGNGTVGNATGMPRATSSGSYNPKPVQFDGGSVLASYVSTELQRAQTELVRANQLKARQESARIAADTVLKGIQSETAKYNLQFKSELKNYYSEIVKWTANNLDVKNTQLHNAVAMQENYLNQVFPKEMSLLEQKLKTGEYTIQQAALKVLSLELQNAKTEEETKRIKEDIEKVKGEVQLNRIRGNVLPVQAGSNVVSSLMSIIRQLTGKGK